MSNRTFPKLSLSPSLKKDAAGKFYLGRMYQEGWGVEPNFTQAVQFFKQASDAGSTRAKVFLADTYVRAYGGNKDEKMARKL